MDKILFKEQQTHMRSGLEWQANPLFLHLLENAREQM